MHVTVDIVFGDSFHDTACAFDVNVIKGEVPKRSVVTPIAERMTDFVS